MAVNFEAFVRWAEDRFDDIIVSGDEIRLNSIFTEDYKHKLWCSPSGGIHNREFGCYRCFKSDTKGTLIGLVMHVDGISYSEAKDILSGQTPIGILEEKLEEFFKEKQSVPKPVSRIKLPSEAVPVTGVALDYLVSRAMPTDYYLYCPNGEYYKRIIIPYYDDNDTLVYFNSRSIDKKAKLRYKGPDKDIGVGKGDVLFCPRWGKNGTKIYLTEGEFDAHSLVMCGLHGVACGGKYLSDKQLGIIKSHNFSVCLCLDTDKTADKGSAPGILGLIEMAKRLKSVYIPVTFVQPPRVCKDWNNMLVAFKPQIVMKYVMACERPLDELTIVQLNSGKIDFSL